MQHNVWLHLNGVGSVVHPHSRMERHRRHVMLEIVHRPMSRMKLWQYRCVTLNLRRMELYCYGLMIHYLASQSRHKMNNHLNLHLEDIGCIWSRLLTLKEHPLIDGLQHGLGWHRMIISLQDPPSAPTPTIRQTLPTSGKQNFSWTHSILFSPRKVVTNGFHLHLRLEEQLPSVSPSQDSFSHSFWVFMIVLDTVIRSVRRRGKKGKMGRKIPRIFLSAQLQKVLGIRMQMT